MQERVKQVLAEVFEVPVASIDETTTQETLGEWTSLAHLRLITALEEAFGIQVPMTEVPDLNSFAAIVAKVGGA